MIMDENLLFSSSQSISAAGTTVCTNVLDFGVAMDLGITDRPLEVFAAWTTAPVGSATGTTTVQYILQTSSTGTSGWVNLLTSAATIDTSVPSGPADIFDIPPGCQEYVQLVVNVASGSLTAGNLTAGIVLDVGTPKSYPRGYTA